jgi:hypothetical protein
MKQCHQSSSCVCIILFPFRSAPRRWSLTVDSLVPLRAVPGFENVCIWKPASSLDWNKAEALCQSTGGGHLPSFTNQRELFFIESVNSFTESFWIGMKRTASTGGSMAGQYPKPKSQHQTLCLDVNSLSPRKSTKRDSGAAQ